MNIVEYRLMSNKHFRRLLEHYHWCDKMTQDQYEAFIYGACRIDKSLNLTRLCSFAQRIQQTTSDRYVVDDLCEIMTLIEGITVTLFREED